MAQTRRCSREITRTTMTSAADPLQGCIRGWIGQRCWRRIHQSRLENGFDLGVDVGIGLHAATAASTDATGAGKGAFDVCGDGGASASCETCTGTRSVTGMPPMPSVRMLLDPLARPPPPGPVRARARRATSRARTRATRGRRSGRSAQRLCPRGATPDQDLRREEDTAAVRRRRTWHRRRRRHARVAATKGVLGTSGRIAAVVVVPFPLRRLDATRRQRQGLEGGPAVELLRAARRAPPVVAAVRKPLRWRRAEVSVHLQPTGQLGQPRWWRRHRRMIGVIETQQHRHHRVCVT